MNPENIKDLRKIVYKKGMWTISLLGEEKEAGRGKDRKFTGLTLEEAINQIPCVTN